MSFSQKSVVLAVTALGAMLLGAGAIGISGAAAQTSPRPAAGPSGVPAQRLNMGVGKSVIVDLPRDAAEIFVGNPKVANAVVRSARKIYVIGAANGQTTIFAMDAYGQQIATIEINIGRDVGELQRILKTALPDSDVVPRTVEDTIIMTGAVASAGEAQKAMDIAEGFLRTTGADGAVAAPGAIGGKVINSLTIRGRDQVMVKVTISEVQRQVLKQLGVTGGNAAGPWGTLTMDNPMSVNTQDLKTALNLGSAGVNGISATMRAFERYGVSRVLAEPTVTSVSGETAKFTAGGEIPVPGGQTCTPDANGKTVCSSGVTYKPYGISLNFTPVVLAEGRILLRVATEVAEVDPTQSFTFQSVNVPAFRTRKNETSVELPSGGSIASAGLLQVKSRQAINGLPGLLNLPVLGALFRSRDYQREETELMIVITPYIAKASKPAELARPDDGFADPTDPQSWLLGRVNKLYSSPSNPQAAKGLNGRYGFIFD